MRGQDSVCTTSRRIVMQAGCGTASGWRFISGAPSATALVPYGVGRARLTSGNFLRASVLWAPSGGVGGDTVSPDEGGGTLRLDITWTADDGTTETDTVEIDMSASTHDDFDEPTGAGAAWGELYTWDVDIVPPVDLSDAAEANRWTVSPTVEVEAYQVGGSRIVDFALYEAAHGVTFESDDDTWTSHVFSVGDPSEPSPVTTQRPRIRRNETTPDGNPRGGTWMTIDVAREQRERFGPVLLSWGNYQETTSTATGGLDGLQRTGSASTLVSLFDSTLTEYDADREGLSVSCGGYARPYRDSNGHVLGAEDAEAAIPVVLRVYGDSTLDTRVRLMTAEDSWVEVELTTSTGWHEGWGWLKVGLNPSDPVVAQVFVDAIGASGGSVPTVDVLAFELEWLR